MSLHDTSSSGPPDGRPILFFDGVCSFCNGTVDFILRWERGPTLRFAPLQSDEARRILGPLGHDPSQLDSLLLWEDGHVYKFSTAALRLSRFLRAPLSWARWLVVVPAPVRDIVYRWVARNRYRWFGQTESCRMPTPQLRERFLA